MKSTPTSARKRRKIRRRAAAIALFVSSLSGASAAEGASTPLFPPAGRLLLSSFGEVSNVDAGGGLGLRVSLPQGFQVGGSASGYAVRKLYLSGYESSGAAVQGRIFAIKEFAVTAPLSLSLRLGSGWRHLSSEEATPVGSTADRLVSDLAILGHFRVAPRVTLLAGWTMLVDLQVAPEVTVASLGGLLNFGGSYAFSKRFALFGELRTGGVYGFNGNNEKVTLSGLLGISAVFGEGARPWQVY